mmetsp:Transcript_25147/g.67187  ORF Transcript_25147/g.67187 Transcript_25147/m.67187 type:complete len:221 (+) Transcript_25147:333-995(+)
MNLVDWHREHVSANVHEIVVEPSPVHVHEDHSPKLRAFTNILWEIIVHFENLQAVRLVNSFLALRDRNASGLRRIRNIIDSEASPGLLQRHDCKFDIPITSVVPFWVDEDDPVGLEGRAAVRLPNEPRDTIFFCEFGDHQTAIRTPICEGTIELAVFRDPSPADELPVLCCAANAHLLHLPFPKQGEVGHADAPHDARSYAVDIAMSRLPRRNAFRIGHT